VSDTTICLGRHATVACAVVLLIARVEGRDVIDVNGLATPVADEAIRQVGINPPRAFDVISETRHLTTILGLFERRRVGIIPSDRHLLWVIGHWSLVIGH
jgi:hypothetical protein